MSAPFVSTIGTGGTYSTLAAWLADMPADITTGAGAGSYAANLKSQAWSQSGTFLTLSGITTDASHTVTIGCDAGAGFRDAAGAATNALYPSAANGVCLISSGFYTPALVVSIANATIRGLQVNAGSYCVDGTGSSNLTLDSCLMLATGAQVVHAFSGGTIRNCVLVNATTGSGGAALFGTVSVQDTTFVKRGDATGGGTGCALSYATARFTGCAFFGFATAVAGSAIDSASDYNATDLASLGAGYPSTAHNKVSQSYSACFVNTGTTPANTDLRIGTSSPLKDAGTAMSGVGTDVVGTTRPQGAAPDIGAFEYPAADTTAPVVASANVNAAGTTLTIAFTEAGSPPVLPASSVTGFTLTASGGAVTLSSTAISSTTFTATTSRTIASGETLTLAYAPGNVTDSAATPNALATFSGTSVTNNSTQVAGATTYAAPLSPTTITAGQTTTATITPNANYTGTVTGTPSGSASTGMAAQTTSAWSSNAVAKTVSWTPTVAGTLTITWTNSGSLANPSNGTATVNAAALAAGTVSFDSCGPAGGAAFIKVTATAATGGTPTYTYQWQRNVGGGSYSNISGAGVTGATTLTLTDATATAGNAYGYRIVATDSAGTPATATSGAVTAQVYTGGALTGGGFKPVRFGGGF